MSINAVPGITNQSACHNRKKVEVIKSERRRPTEMQPDKRRGTFLKEDERFSALYPGKSPDDATICLESSVISVSARYSYSSSPNTIWLRTIDCYEHKLKWRNEGWCVSFDSNQTISLVTFCGYVHGLIERSNQHLVIMLLSDQHLMSYLCVSDSHIF